VPLGGGQVDADAIVADAATSAALRSATATLALAARERA
jgi:hypothetical protein